MEPSKQRRREDALFQNVEETKQHSISSTIYFEARFCFVSSQLLDSGYTLWFLLYYFCFQFMWLAVIWRVGPLIVFFGEDDRVIQHVPYAVKREPKTAGHLFCTCRYTSQVWLVYVIDHDVVSACDWPSRWCLHRGCAVDVSCSAHDAAHRRHLWLIWVVEIHGVLFVVWASCSHSWD
jgi:hypothetical protein